MNKFHIKNTPHELTYFYYLLKYRKVNIIEIHISLNVVIEAEKDIKEGIAYSLHRINSGIFDINLI